MNERFINHKPQKLNNCLQKIKLLLEIHLHVFLFSFG